MEIKKGLKDNNRKEKKKVNNKGKMGINSVDFYRVNVYNKEKKEIIKS